MERKSGIHDINLEKSQSHSTRKKKSKYSDDFIDGIALVGIIAIIVAGISYWLYNA